MQNCDICKKETEKPALVLIKYWGGVEVQFLVCNECAGKCENAIFRLRRNTCAGSSSAGSSSGS